MSFVVIKACFSQQTYFCHDKQFCCNKLTFVATKRLFSMTKVCLLWQNFCCDKHECVATNICHKKSSVATKNILSWQTLHFSRGKHTFVATKYFCCDKTFLSQANHLICQLRLYLQGIHKLQRWCINWSQQTWLLQKTCTHTKTGEIIFLPNENRPQMINKRQKEKHPAQTKPLTVRNTFSSLSVWNLATKLKLM